MLKSIWLVLFLALLVHSQQVTEVHFGQTHDDYSGFFASGQIPDVNTYQGTVNNAQNCIPQPGGRNQLSLILGNYDGSPAMTFTITTPSGYCLGPITVEGPVEAMEYASGEVPPFEFGNGPGFNPLPHLLPELAVLGGINPNGEWSITIIGGGFTFIGLQWGNDGATLNQCVSLAPSPCGASTIIVTLHLAPYEDAGTNGKVYIGLTGTSGTVNQILSASGIDKGSHTYTINNSEIGFVDKIVINTFSGDALIVASVEVTQGTFVSQGNPSSGATCTTPTGTILCTKVGTPEVFLL